MMRRIAWPAVIVLATVAAYSNTFSVPFLFDDIESIVENPQVREPAMCWTRIGESRQLAVSGRPLVCWTLGINYAISGLRTWSYHATNLAIHLAAALTLYGIVRRTGLRRMGGQDGGRCPPYGGEMFGSPELLAGLTATIWALHPLQTESVTYVMQRTENLCGLFVLLTLYCCVRAWDGDGADGRAQNGGRRPPYRNGTPTKRHGAWSVGAVLCCMSGVFCKELIAVVPLLVLFYDRAFLSGTFKGALRGHWRVYVGLTACWPILLVLNAYGPRTDSIGFHLGMTPLMYLRTQASVLLHYLRLAVWPDSLVVSYFDWPIAWTWMEALPAGLVIVGLLGMVACGVWENRWWGFAGAWFFVLLAPTSSVVPIVTEIAAERRMYLSLAAIVAMVVFGVARVLGYCDRGAAVANGRRRGVQGGVTGSSREAQEVGTEEKRIRRADPTRGALSGAAVRFGVLGCAIVVAGAFGVRTYLRNEQYRSELVLWEDAAEKRPENPLVLCALGSALDADGKYAEALEEYQEAARLNGEVRRVQSATLAEALHYNMGRTLASLGRIEEAIGAYREALRLKPRLARAHNNLAALLIRTGRLAEAREHGEEAVRLAPQSANARSNLGVVLSGLGDSGAAIGAFREAVRLDPAFADAWHNLGRTLMSASRSEEAVEALKIAVKLRPADAEIAAALDEAEARAKSPVGRTQP